jgi:hypothetical protein
MTLSSDPSRKRGREEDDDDESRGRRLVKEEKPLAPEEPEEVLPPPPDEPEEVPPPPPEEPEEMTPPSHEEALTSQPVEVVYAPTLTADEATWSVNLFCEAFNRLRQVAVHLEVPASNDLLQRTVKDYIFKIHILDGDLERGMLAPSTMTTEMMAALTAPAPAPTPTVGLLWWGSCVPLFMCSSCVFVELVNLRDAGRSIHVSYNVLQCLW